MPDQIKSAMKRAAGYWYEDGLAELGTGIVMLFIGVLFGIEANAPAGSSQANISSIGLPLVITIGYLIARWGIRTAKSRIVYPRTGEVTNRQASTRRKLASAGLALVIGMTLVMLVRAQPMSAAWIIAAQGAVVGIGAIWIAQSMGLSRFFALGIWSAVVGAALMAAGVGESAGNALYYSLLGMALLISGAVTLRDYLRHAPPKVAL